MAGDLVCSQCGQNGVVLARDNRPPSAWWCTSCLLAAARREARLREAAQIVQRGDVTLALGFLSARGVKPPYADPDAYEVVGQFEADARYSYPARAELWAAVLAAALAYDGKEPGNG